MNFGGRELNSRADQIRSNIETVRRRLRVLQDRRDYVLSNLASQVGGRSLEDKLEGYGRDLAKLDAQLQDADRGIDDGLSMMVKGNRKDAEWLISEISYRVKDFSDEVGRLEKRVDEILIYAKSHADKRPRVDAIEPLAPPNLRGEAHPQIAVEFSTRNDKHHEDAVRVVINDRKNLKGIVVCDGITNANGELAASATAETVQTEFRRMEETSDVGKIRKQLDWIVAKAVDNIRGRGNSKHPIETATTLLLAFTDGSGFFIYYIGDGTIRQFTADAYSVADYLLTYDRGGALQGYVSSSGVVSSPTFVYVNSKVSQDNILVLASDGAELNDTENHLYLANKLRTGLSPRKDSLRKILDDYLEHLDHRTDDATIGAIWVTGSN